MKLRPSPLWSLVPVAALACVAEPAQASERIAFNIPPDSLATALATFGRQAGVSIGSADSRIAAIHVRGLRGRYTLEQGLQRLLRGTGYSFQIVDRHTVRILRVPPAASRPRARRIAPARAAPPSPPVVSEIVVTASKRPSALRNFPGSAIVITPEDLGITARVADGTASLTEKVPSLISTSLGRGRNKLFIRGVADSSFTGPTQATVGEYFGDVRMNYSAPDPDLSLYDVDRVEILEGPQGTLYGAGTLGGIMHIVPTPVDVGDASADIRMGLSITAQGEPGHDAAAVANLPIIEGTAGVRVVAYSSMAGGYIDNPLRRIEDTNDVRVAGGRVSIRLLPRDWEIELGGVLQDVKADDSQYVQPDRDELIRSGGEQPFSNRFVLWRAVARRSFGWGDLTSASGVVRHRLDATYDLPSGQGQSVEATEIDLLSHETRLASSRARRFNWVAGISILRGVDRIESRSTGSAEPVGVRNETLEAALFGEATLPVAMDVSATLGGRLSYSRIAGEPLTGVDLGEELARSRTRLLPTFALSWRDSRRFGAYLRYQQGFRAGGLSVKQTDDGLAAQAYESDKIDSVEAGVRLGRQESGSFYGTLAASYSRWRDVQADLISSTGQPFTDNIGSGSVLTLEANATWKPTPDLTGEVRAMASRTCLDPGAGLEVDSEDENLPNIPRLAIAGTVKYDIHRFAGGDLQLEAAARYAGKSQLGFGPLLDVPQGDYFILSAGARLVRGPTEFTLDVSNLFDSRGNRFSFGNPFTLSEGRQFTPLRPRTIRVGISRSF